MICVKFSWYLYGRYSVEAPASSSSVSSASSSSQRQSGGGGGVSDNSGSATGDNFRAPRVHFVTQRRSESNPPPVIRPYEREREREGRADRGWRSDYRSPDYYGRSPPSSRGWRDYDQYAPPPPPPPPSSYYRRSDYRRKYEPYYRYDDYDRYDYRRYEPPPPPPRYYDRYDSAPRGSRNNNRIIYYATLPEISRRPSSGGYYGSNWNSDGYRYRKSPYYDQKGSYEQDRDGSKVPYPVKVSTNVNVRDTKKNPELRIYSENDRSRYAYKVPSYQSDEAYNNRQA